MKDLRRITTDPQVMGGKPCIRGLRVTVGTIVGLVAAGHSKEEILALYPYLEEADITEALAYAAWRPWLGTRQRLHRFHQRPGFRIYSGHYTGGWPQCHSGADAGCNPRSSWGHRRGGFTRASRDLGAGRPNYH